MTKTQTTHGGPRKGAGRPKLGKSARIACRVPIEIKEFLTKHPDKTETELIIQAIRSHYNI